MKNYSSWKVAAAILLKEGIPIHYREITDRVIDTNLSTLGKSGTTPSYTLNRIMNSDHPEIFTNVGSGRFVVKDIASNNSEVQDILSLLKEINSDSDSSNNQESFSEGEKKWKFATYYERSPALRNRAIEIHGTTCMVPSCGFNFKKIYGEHGKDFIEVHHRKPISKYKGKEEVNPETDMVVVCSNCHRMIHRTQDHVLSLDDVNNLILNSST